jgi:hypothetical protein
MTPDEFLSYMQENEYKSLLNDYDIDKDDMEWIMRDMTHIKLKDMEETHMRNCIKMLERKKLNNDRDRTWIYIFENQLLIRRSLKLKKIMNNIKNGRN